MRGHVRHSLSKTIMSDIRPIAFYLPQFYATPYNNEWWGEGYTEWVAARGAKPLFEGHYQPQLPASDDGYLDEYNQTNLETLEAQIALAKAYGVHGFCHYYYWFDGNRVLEKPTDLMLATPSLDMPFCLCWANENWSRRWDGQEADVLIPQNYDPDSYARFAADLVPYITDPRYIKVSNKILFLIYRPDEIPELAKLVEAIKAQARTCGFDGALVYGAETFVAPGQQKDPRAAGLDGAIEFPPHGIDARMYYLRNPKTAPKSLPEFEGRIFDAFDAYMNSLERPVPDYPLLRSAFPAWDNTARRGDAATVFAGSSPGLFRHWVAAIANWTRKYGEANAPFIFINAWNEWAEGAHLEPDHIYGFEYLEALKAGISAQPELTFPYDWNTKTTREFALYRESARSALGCAAGLADVARRMKQCGLTPEQKAPYDLNLIELNYLAQQLEKTTPRPRTLSLISNLRRARNWHEIKTAIWQAFNHAHPRTPWQKFTTWIFRYGLGKR